MTLLYVMGWELRLIDRGEHGRFLGLFFQDAAVAQSTVKLTGGLLHVYGVTSGLDTRWLVYFIHDPGHAILGYDGGDPRHPTMTVQSVIHVPEN